MKIGVAGRVIADVDASWNPSNIGSLARLTRAADGLYNGIRIPEIDV
jgi:hypothetical protein